MKVLLTGGAGFTGFHVVDHILQNTDWEIILLDKLDHSGNLNRLTPIWNNRVKWIYHDLRAELNSQLRAQIGKVDYILHLAAGTHVDRSIVDPLSFVYDNVLGTAHMLEFARHSDIEKMIYFSTDEVFGPAPIGVKYKEWDRYNSGNPYSATKAGGEELALAYHNTYKMPVLITHTMNIFAQKQHPEKYIPMTIRNVRDDQTVIVHVDKDGNPGSRFYIHARNVADALLFLLDKGLPGDKYNIVGEMEVDNLELAKNIALMQGKALKYQLVDFHSSRPGHDPRYALCGDKLAAMGWKPKVPFYESLETVVNWTLENPIWLL